MPILKSALLFLDYEQTFVELVVQDRFQTIVRWYSLIKAELSESQRIMLYSDENRTNTLSVRRNRRTKLYSVDNRTAYKTGSSQLSTKTFAIARVLLTASRGNTLPYPKLLPQSCSRGGALP